jgi:hypothetical protein
MQDVVMSFVSDDRDLRNKRSIELTNGNKIHFERSDPYGFWKVHYDKGQVPVKLQGQYTSFEQAEMAVRGYLTDLGKEPVSEQKEQKAVKVTGKNAA